MTEKYDAIVVLSGGDIKTIRLRIEKALDLYHEDKSENLVFNGFNTKEAHNTIFKGDWYNDSRLEPFCDEIEQIHPYIIYARTTEQNAYETKRLARERGWKKMAVISSETHMKRVKRLHHKMFPNYLNLDFIASPEPNERIRKRRTVKEGISDFITYLSLWNLPRGHNPVNEEFTYLMAEVRKKKWNSLLKKILKCLKIVS